LGPDASLSLNRGDSNYIVAIDDLEDALSSKASSIPGRSIWDLFLKKIWSIDSCDALEVFFSEISAILVKSREEQIRDRDNGLAPETGPMRLSRCSPLGAFVRRAQLEFTRLQFHDSVKLWKGFVHYRLPTYRVWSKKNPSAERDPVDINLLELNLDSTSHLAQVAYGNIEIQEEDGTYVSTKDVERLLEFQIGELQSTQTFPVKLHRHDAHLLTECRAWRTSPRWHESAARTYHDVWRRNTQPDLLPKVRPSSRKSPAIADDL
jgi:anaphase-promoting complex subunit 5